MYWFTSDLHFFHANIIKFCNRPFNDIDHMNEMLIKNWNEVVSAGDIVWVLGDFSLSNNEKLLSNILRRLNGQKHLVTGNHDSKSCLRAKEWGSVHDLTHISVNNQAIVLCHYAMRVWHKSHHGSWMLHGHSHATLEEDKNIFSFDIGVDAWDYYPVSFEQVSKKMKWKENNKASIVGKKGGLDTAIETRKVNSNFRK